MNLIDYGMDYEVIKLSYFISYAVTQFMLNANVFYIPICINSTTENLK